MEWELGLGPSVRKPLLVSPPPAPAPTSQNPVLGTGSFHPCTRLGWALQVSGLCLSGVCGAEPCPGAAGLVVGAPPSLGN